MKKEFEPMMMTEEEFERKCQEEFDEEVAQTINTIRVAAEIRKEKGCPEPYDDCFI